MAGNPGDRSLKETPTWAVAVVCAVIVIISVMMEHGIHRLGKWFQKRQKKAMSEALEKIKAELMLLGFISLLLTVGQRPISKICIPAKAGSIMLPCKVENAKGNEDGGHRKLLWYGETTPHRILASSTTDYCSRYKDKVPLISQSGIHQLHIFIFVLAVFHVLYSVLTMALGQAKAHLSLNSKFDFHKYIKRSLEDDFKVVVGISLPLWFMAILILLLDVYGLGTLIWISFVPLIVLLLVGMKLEIVIMEMAREIQDRTAVIKGTPIVEPNDKFFWFNRPQWILFLIHLTLFENAFQMAHFLWTWSTFGLKSCINENLAFTFLKVIMGLALQFLCSYITFPLYALVTQMGSHMKKAIFEEQTAKALMKWQQAAKEKKRLRDAGISFTLGYKSGETTPSRGTSPMHLLHKYKSNSVDPESTLSSPKSYRGDTDFPDIEAPKLFKLETPKETRRPTLEHLDVDVANNDFSFSIQ
ncbi:MLO protein homolog 1-like isoform X3 [Typha angustifolia]|uniref:MLO protein homolog 1-like isoform X3 n=1 Tax=Typha angustifolia TaxID=59011 RepID=UPI003C2F5711